MPRAKLADIISLDHCCWEEGDLTLEEPEEEQT